jgi:hypothetical protein
MDIMIILLMALFIALAAYFATLTIYITDEKNKLDEKINSLIKDNIYLKNQVLDLSDSNFELKSKINRISFYSQEELNNFKTYVDRTYIKKTDNNQVTYNG